MDKKVKRKTSCSGESKRIGSVGLKELAFGTVLSCIFLFCSCDYFKVRNDDKKIVARVYDHELSLNDVREIFPGNISKQDSVDLVQRYIRSWISKQLLLRTAEGNTNYNKEEVERKVLDYKYALIVFEYQKKFISERLDTTVSEKEIETYYQKNIDNFELKQNIVKGTFVKAPSQKARINKLKKLLQEKDKNYKAIASFCYRFATNYVLEDTVWTNFDDLIGSSPFSNIPDKVQFLKKTKFSEMSDESFTYLLFINDYKIVDQNSPIEFVKPQIVDIILNKRKIDLIEKLEKDIYNKALKNKDFEIFTENN